MKKIILALFAFTSRERIGTILLAAILLAFLTARILAVYLPVKREPYLNEEAMAILEEFGFNKISGAGIVTVGDPVNTRSADTLSATGNNKTALYLQETFNPSEGPVPGGTYMHSFDPNTATLDELQKLGLSPRVSETLIKYRNSGGRFREAADIKKIYGLTTRTYEMIKDYISISGGNTPDSAVLHYKNLEINSADSALLTTLYGIGPVLAARIIKYRKLLGGFYSAGQLKEVYGISDSLYLSIAEHVYADTSFITKIKINIAGEKQLAVHPYIGAYYAAGIIKYREFKGSISGSDEMIDNNLLPESYQMKAMNYIDFY